MIKVIHTGPFSVNTLIVEAGENKVFVVDPAGCSFCGDENSVEKWIKDNKFELCGIILTHGHFDHVAGLKYLKQKYPEAPVLIHKNDSNFIGADSEKIQSAQLDYMGFNEFIPSVSNLPGEDGYLENGITLAQAFTGAGANLSSDVEQSLLEWKVLHTPGHTMGCICLYNESKKLLISGDTLFYRSWGRTDLGGDEGMIQKSLKMLYETVDPDTVVYPGHEYTAFKMSDNY